MFSKNFYEQLKRDEGFYSTPYWDIRHYSWGYGTRAPQSWNWWNTPRITKAQASEELMEYCKIVEKELIQIFGDKLKKISQVRIDCLGNMLYNLGLTNFSSFRNMISEIKSENINWPAVAFHAYDSRWYGQVGNRSKRIVREIAYGK